ncbi:MAG: hypothetical protein N2038_02770, partial [Geminicoccaceae bacterium]|nr:hypothetical protein [Geminicoccaceae bacterium]
MVEFADPLPLALFWAALGFFVGLALGLLWGRRERAAVAELLAQAERKREAETEALLDGVKLAFGEIALDHLRRVAEQLAQGLETTLSAERR